jgi:uncharacterized phage protein (TIGR01671 family)
MKAIKFRAWVVNEVLNTMFYPETIALNSACAHSLWHKVGFTTDMPDEYDNIIEQWQKDIVWLQFTGLTDKNGKEIYEGDICNTRDGDLLTCYNYNSFIYMVLFSEEHSGVNGYSQKELEVIGNIYENPELLKKE